MQHIMALRLSISFYLESYHLKLEIIVITVMLHNLLATCVLLFLQLCKKNETIIQLKSFFFSFRSRGTQYQETLAMSKTKVKVCPLKSTLIPNLSKNSASPRKSPKISWLNGFPRDLLPRKVPMTKMMTKRSLLTRNGSRKNKSISLSKDIKTFLWEKTSQYNSIIIQMRIFVKQMQLVCTKSNINSESKQHFAKETNR